MEFASQEKIDAVAAALLLEFFEVALSIEYEPLFLSDEAKIWDVSSATPEELTKKLSEHYGTSVTPEDLNRPLWELLPALDARRKKGGIS